MDDKLKELKGFYEEKYCPDRFKEANIEKINQQISIMENVTPMKTMNRNPSKKRQFRLAYSFLAAVLALGVFIGSAAVSPVMADVLTKLPFFEKLFASHKNGLPIFPEALDHIRYKIEKEGYSIGTMGYSPQSKSVEMSLVVSKEQYAEAKEVAINITTQFLKENGLGKIKVSVMRDTIYEYNLESETGRLQMELQQVLGMKSFHDTHILIEKTIVTVSYKKNKDYDQEEIRNIVTGYFKNQTETGYTVTFKTYNHDSYISGETVWSSMFVPLEMGLVNVEEYKFSSISHKYTSEKCTIIIHTKLTKDDKGTIKELENSIVDFIIKAKVPEKTNNQNYEIIIKGKGNKRLN
ncbi:hypothetical protein FZW96_06320 [Bacillus sp. BGMRC 2118]|nr:hypothetical protein FZW96_06320 [Bacillus sp. BGMRC 2118]